MPFSHSRTSPKAPPPKDYRFDLGDFRIEASTAPFTSTMRLEEMKDGRQILSLELRAEEEAQLPPFTLKWSAPSADVDAFWNPDVNDDKQNYYRNSFTSRATVHAPVSALL
ncbi:MAG: hypothetical protein AAF368_07815, partial [Planctomycetota bacterium]